MYNRNIIPLFVLFTTIALACDTHKQANCVVGDRACKCFEFELVHTNVDTFIESDGFEQKETTYTYKITNYCRKPVTSIVIGTAFLDTTFTTDDVVQSSTMASMNYTVEVGLMAGSPAFNGVKFVPSGESWIRGMWELFTVTVIGEVSSSSVVMLQGQAGATWETYGHVISHCQCLECIDVCTPGRSGPNCNKCVGDGNGSRKKWWCMPRYPEPTNPTARKYDLLLVDTRNGDPIIGVPAGGDRIDGKGRRLDCDCSIIETPCTNHCFGNGDCDTNIGACSCASGFGDNCDPVSPSSTSSSGSSSTGNSDTTGTNEPERPCEDLGFCFSHGRCNTQTNECDCTVPGWTGPDCNTPVDPDTCNDINKCGECISAQMGCHWCWPKGAAAPLCNQTCPEFDDVLVCDTTFIVWTPPKCPDQCSGRGQCVNDVCVCNKGWQGANCGDAASLLSTEETLAVGVGVGVVVIVAIIAGAFLILGGGGAAYKYYKLNAGKIDNANENPLYQETGKGVNPFYVDQQNA